MQATSTETIERTIHIDAKPETVFAFFTDPEKLYAWMGRSGTIEARPGGLFRLDYNGFDVMRGEFVEVVPPSRVVFTWGWETLGDGTPPGASTVTVTLTPEGEGTRLQLVHTGLSEMDAKSHGEGWDMFLSRLSTAAAGGAVEPMASPLSPGEEYASRLNAALVRARYAIEAIPGDRWKATTSENRPVNALARHVADHIGVLAIAQGIISGEPGPFASVTLDDLHARNAVRDAEQAEVTREEVLEALRSEGPKAVEAIKAMSDADLSASAPMAFAGGQPVPARMVIEGPLLADIESHLAHIQQAAS